MTETNAVEALAAFLIESVPIDELPDVDAIFVFGHYDSAVAKHAAGLKRVGKANKIIISGKGRDRIPNGYASEADFYADILHRNRITDEEMILEKEATNTLENVRFGIGAAHRTGFFPKTLILCAVPPLLRRTIATFRKQWPAIQVFGSAYALSQSWFTDARLCRMIGELDRLRDYALQGDIVPVDVPDRVVRAAEKIRRLHCR